MKNQINKPTLNVSALGLKLKVIRVGKSPKLSAPSGKNVRHLHSHFTYEAFFITHGYLEFVTDIESTIYERGVVIIPPHIGHYTIPSGDGCFCLLFSIENRDKEQEFIQKIRTKLDNGVCTLPISQDVDYYIKALSRKSDVEDFLAEKDSELLATLIFNEVLNQLCPMRAQGFGASDSKHIGAIETYINANIQNKITLSDVASQVYLSNKQVSRIIQREYGCTLSALVTEKKLASAKKLLKDTDMKVGEIALNVNLGAENYFYMLFKQKYGLSPLQYRKKSQDKKPKQ